MKRAGRSVAAASRVIEIDEVLVAISADGFSAGQSCFRIWRLTSSFSVAASMTTSLQRLLAVALGDQLALDLAAHILTDRLQRLGQHRLIDVGELDAITRQRRHMGDAAAHLARADDPDRLDLHLAHGLVPTGHLESSSASAGMTWNRSPTRP
jgi:hypothetical protein